MKSKFLILLSCFSLVACAQRMDDDSAGDDDGQHQPDTDDDPTPDPDPACDSDDDCLDDLGCNVGVCRQGACSYESTCSDGQVCDVQTDRCETPTVPTTHGISCFHTGDTLYLTIAGQLTDSVYGGSLANPKFVSVASDQIPDSWNVNASTTAPKVVLTDAERTSGYVASASINLPSNQAQRFTLMVWSDDSGGYARRLDLGDWTVSGDGCARIDDGAPEGSTDGYVIGRAPLCASACDDGNASTTDICSATGCIHEGGPTDPTYGTLHCSESGSNTTVTVTGPILANVFNNAGLVPNSSASIRFGYGGTDSKSWTSDTAAYALTMPNTVAGFNLMLLDQNGVEHWFNVNQFNVSGTCSKGTGEFSHTPGSGGSGTGYGTLSCSESGTNTIVTVTGPIVANVFNNAGLVPNSSATVRFGYGGSDSRNWVSDTSAYTLTMPNTVAGFNLKLLDQNGVEHWFNVNQFNVSGTCSKGTGEFRHTVGSGTSPDGYGHITCSVNGPDMTVTINGVLSHTVSGTINPTTSWRIQYGSPQDGWTVPYPSGVSKPMASWVNNSTTYTIVVSSSINGFNFALTDGVNPYWFDLNEYTMTGCYVSSGAIYH